MKAQVLAELRLLTQTRFDSRCILGIVLAGDERLPERLSRPELLPVASRIRSRLGLEAVTSDDLRACLQHRMKVAGNAKLMTSELLAAICEHGLGNYRIVVNIANELLSHAAQRELDVLDEKLYFDVFNQTSPPAEAPPPRGVRGRRRR
jgi:general secretion pathway protein A